MFDDIPEMYRNQTADNEEEGWRYTQGDKNAAARPSCSRAITWHAALSARSRKDEGSPHGGVFLDISWIKEKIPKAAEHIKKKLPSMYHQFKQLADVDITKEPMEVGPTTHYIMGGVRVDADTQMTTVPGLFAAGECAAGLMAQIDSAEILFQICWCSANGRRVRGAVRKGKRCTAS